MGENKELNIDWNKFKVKTKKCNLMSAKKGYIEFCNMLEELEFELISDYIGVMNKVELVYKFNKTIRFYISPNNFKKSTYKTLIDFKNNLIENGDKFVKFVGLSDRGSLIAQIKTFDGGEINIDIRSYNSFNNSRKDFYKKLNEVNGSIKGCYIDVNTKINILVDKIKLNQMNPSVFKTYTYKAIINFKKELEKNGDSFIKFIGLTNNGKLIARIKTFDGGEKDIVLGFYKKWSEARQDFYNKLKEVNGYTNDFYKGKDIKMNILIDDVKLNPISPHNFKTQTYKRILNFKKDLSINNDKLLKFTNLSGCDILIVNIQTFDGGIATLPINNYKQWDEGRQSTYDYCKENGYKILSPYIGCCVKILIDFNCDHKPHWIKSNALKNNQGCPICSESKGEKSIRTYLENNNIEFIQEHRFEDCRYKNPLSFDFYIPDYNLCIEFDGRQHFEAIDHFGGEENLKLTQKRDKIKNDYCKNNGVRLFRIPYWEIDNIEKILDGEFEKLIKLKEVC